MKKICSFLLTLILLLGLTACGQGGASSAASASGGPTWQEQYDLGVRYLSEGSYAEAILAFTAAIDIDPKRPDAFIGRGDAYVGTAQLAAGEDAAELPEESRTAYESAVADYLAAIGLDKLLAAVYGKAADVYLALGDREAALAILQQGVDATGDADLSARAEALQDDRPEGASETVAVEGVFINQSEYFDLMKSYTDSIQEDSFQVRSEPFGIRLSQPVEVEVDGQMAVIREAKLTWLDDVIPGDELQWNPQTHTNGPLIGKRVRLTGYFYKNEVTEEFSGPFIDEKRGESYYFFRPYGDYVFYATGYEELG